MQFRSMLSTAVAVVGLAVMAAPTFALPVTFAQFQQAISGNQFTFTNNSTSPNNLKLTANLPVTFKFLVPSLYGLPVNTPIAAQLVVTATATVPAGTSGAHIFQGFSTVSMTFVAVGGPHPGSNLLTIVSTSNGELDGNRGANSGSLNGDTGSGSVVNFTSDFLVFTATIERAYTLSFTSLNPALGLGSHTATNHQTTGYLKSFTAAGTGTFASDPAPTTGVPEPSPAIALLIGSAGLTLLFVRNRKIATARPLAA